MRRRPGKRIVGSEMSGLNDSTDPWNANEGVGSQPSKSAAECADDAELEHRGSLPVVGKNADADQHGGVKDIRGIGSASQPRP